MSSPSVSSSLLKPVETTIMSTSLSVETLEEALKVLGPYLNSHLGADLKLYMPEVILHISAIGNPLKQTLLTAS